MPTICIQGATLSYEESDIIAFDEGLIGFPHLRRMVLVRQSDIAPFLWLVPLDDERLAFLTIDPRTLLADYASHVPTDVRARLTCDAEDQLLMLCMVVMRADPSRSTVNLRAPVLISARAMRGLQTILADSSYRVDQPLLVAEAA